MKYYVSEKFSELVGSLNIWAMIWLSGSEKDFLTKAVVSCSRDHVIDSHDVDDLVKLVGKLFATKKSFREDEKLVGRMTEMLNIIDTTTNDGCKDLTQFKEDVEPWPFSFEKYYLPEIEQKVKEIGKGYMCNFHAGFDKIHHYINGSNTICFTFTYDDGEKVKIHGVGGSRFAYPDVMPVKEFVEKLPTMLLTAEECDAIGIAGELGMK